MTKSNSTTNDRFCIRPNIDPNNEEAFDQLADDIAGWVMKQRDRVQAEIAAEKASLLDIGGSETSNGSQPKSNDD